MKNMSEEVVLNMVSHSGFGCKQSDPEQRIVTHPLCLDSEYELLVHNFVALNSVRQLQSAVCQLLKFI